MSASLTNTTDSYGTVSKAFHWTTAVLIIALIPLGLIANELPYDTDAQLTRKALLFSIHKTLGVLAFFVALLRIIWAITQPKPGELHPDRKAETFLADLVHWLLYGSLVLVPLSGWIHHAATTGFAPIWWPFGQSLPFVPKDNAIAESFGALHWVWTKILGISLFLHVAGALKHHFIDKDVTLLRMWFGTPALPTVGTHMARMGSPFIAVALFAFSGAAMSAIGHEDHAAEPEVAELADVASDWEVQDGTLGIQIIQFGGNVDGSFAEWTADIDFDPETKSGSVEVAIAIGSLTLGSVTSQAMDAAYFDVANHPSATFQGPITHVDGDSYQSAGMLTLKGQSADVTLSFTLTEADGLWTMSGGTTVDRRDFAIGENDGEGNLGFTVQINTDLSAKLTNE